MTEEQANEFKPGDRVAFHHIDVGAPGQPHTIWRYGIVERITLMFESGRPGDSWEAFIRADEKLYDIDEPDPVYGEDYSDKTLALEGHGWYEDDYVDIQHVTDNEGIRCTE